jgi:hypothetical protein
MAEPGGGPFGYALVRRVQALDSAYLWKADGTDGRPPQRPAGAARERYWGLAGVLFNMSRKPCSVVSLRVDVEYSLAEKIAVAA